MRNRTCESCNTTLQTQSCNGIPCKCENDRSGLACDRVLAGCVRLLVCSLSAEVRLWLTETRYRHENSDHVAPRIVSLVSFCEFTSLISSKELSPASLFFNDFCSLKTTNPRK